MTAGISSTTNAREPPTNTGIAILRGNSHTRTGWTLGAQVTIAAAAKSQNGSEVGIHEKSAWIDTTYATQPANSATAPRWYRPFQNARAKATRIQM